MITHLSALLAFIFCCTMSLLAQQPAFTRADTLRGMLTPLRTCYDVTYYHLDITVDTTTRSIAGSNTIAFRVVQDFDRMQADLFANMKVEKIEFEGKALPYERELNAVFIRFPRRLQKAELHEIKFFYSGVPQEARRPPWEGGFTWSYDKLGNLWVAVTCQGTGASLWWPNKDHQSDEPDSMTTSVTVPEGFMNVSNGRLRSTASVAGGKTRFDWFLSSPINNYNVTVNIAKYAHFSDLYRNDNGDLSLDYYVMPYNLEKAKEQFKQVKPMMACFEKYFGSYPFPRDGYKLVESPHLGMEHQSAVAYGNEYLQGYRGTSSSEVGTKFDFIIVHETAHEWWGNSVTSEDIADMWIHESFGAYAEAVYVECLFGYEEAMKYVNGKKWNVRNDEPIIGVYGVHKRGSGDMYDKGQLVLNTLRHVVGDDQLWWSILKGLAEEYRHKVITADTVFQYVNRRTGKDLNYFFEQYFKRTTIPQLDIVVTKKGEMVTARYRWVTDMAEFRMPVKVTIAKDKFSFIYPTTTWQTTTLEGVHPEEFKVAEDQFFIGVRLRKMYVDPQAPR
ncbi:MAG: M1 family metallopeptidase [Bacteroidota bacterium]